MTINHSQAKISSIMQGTFQKNAAEIRKIFSPLTTEQRYDTLIEMGRRLPLYPESCKTPDRIVHGCQSTLYLHTDIRDGKLFFQACADALISAGLAALLIAVYSGETPETILKSPPRFIDELGIAASLSPHRSNGLAQIYLRMKQEAIQSFTHHLP